MMIDRMALIGLVLLAGCTRQVALVKGQVPVIAGSLEGGPWLVEDLNGGGSITAARVDLSFDPGDHDTSSIHGRAGCNRYTGRWQQAGNSVKFGPLALTRMLCPPAIMETERKVIAALSAVTSVSFDASGAALLRSPDGRVIKIRREKPA